MKDQNMALSQNGIQAVDNLKAAMNILTLLMVQMNQYRDEVTPAQRQAWDAARVKKMELHGMLADLGHEVAPGVVPQGGGT